MRILQVLILCLCALAMHAQTKKNRNSSDTYLFEKATFTVYNANSKAVVNTRTITDLTTVTVDDMFYQNIFQEAVIYDENTLLFCVLPDKQYYSVNNQFEITVIPTPSMPKEDKRMPLRKSPFPQGRLVPYSMSVNNGILTFSVTYLYGDSQHNFPLEAKLVFTMIKQK